MPREFGRNQRLGAQIQRELAGLLDRALGDQRGLLPTVTAVELTRDLSIARVFVSSMQGVSRAKDLLDALAQAAPALRRELGARLRVRSLPELRFEYDRSSEDGARLSRIIDDALEADRKPAGPVSDT